MRGTKIGGAVVAALLLLLAVAYGVQAYRLKQQLTTLSAALGTATGGQNLLRVTVLSQEVGVPCAKVRLELSSSMGSEKMVIPAQVCPGPFPITRKFSFVPRGGAIVLYEKDDFATVVQAFSGDVDFKGTLQLKLSMNELELPTKDLTIHGALTASIAHDLSAYELRYDGDGSTWSTPMFGGETKRTALRFARDGAKEELTCDLEHLSFKGGDGEVRIIGLKGRQTRLHSSPTGFDYEGDSTGSLAEISIKTSEGAVSFKGWKAEGSETGRGGLMDANATLSTADGNILGRPARLDLLEFDLSNFNQKVLAQLGKASPETFGPALLKAADEFLGSHPKVVLKLKATTGYGAGSVEVDLALKPVPLDALMRSQGRAALKASISLQVDQTGVETLLDAIDQSDGDDPIQSASHKTSLLESLEKHSLLVRDGAMFKTQLSFDGENAPLVNGKIIDAAALQAVAVAQQPTFLPRLRFLMPVVTGPHEMIKVQGALMRGAGQVQQCWQEVPGAALVSQGSLRLSFRILSNGKVTNARSLSITTGGEILDDCIARQVGTLEFPTAPATSMVQVDVDYVPADGGGSPRGF